MRHLALLAPAILLGCSKPRSVAVGPQVRAPVTGSPLPINGGTVAFDATATPAQEKELAREIARGHEGLVRYLALPAGRSVQSAVLWVTGAHYDVFGWESAKYGNPEAAAAIRGALHPPTAAGPPAAAK